MLSSFAARRTERGIVAVISDVTDVRDLQIPSSIERALRNAGPMVSLKVAEYTTIVDKQKSLVAVRDVTLGPGCYLLEVNIILESRGVLVNPLMA